MVNTLSRYNRLQSFGSQGDSQKELLKYTENSFFSNGTSSFELKSLEDEPLVANWESYIEEAYKIGVYQTLKKYLVQFRFPIKDTISQTDEYKDATLRGHSTQSMKLATGLFLTEPDKLRLFLHPTLVGRIPVIIANNRFDFQSIIRALSYRNEPKSMPKSMGAAMIQGLNNWDRLKKSIQLASQSEVLKNKALYQDRIIVLSRIPYSNVAASEMDMDHEVWLDKSLSIRLEHECAHYFTLRQFGKMSNNMHDEIIADYMGIHSVLTHFNSSWFLRFVGLADYPNFNNSGRLKNYIGDPPLSEESFKTLQTIVKQAAENIEKFDKEIKNPINIISRRSRMGALCLLNLMELASEDGTDLLLERFNNLQANI